MIAELSDLIKANPLVAGLGGATAAGYVFSHIRSLPGRIWSSAKAQFSSELTVWSEDKFFFYLNRWLSQHPSTRKMRRLSVADWQTEGTQEFALTPGPGFHVIWQGKRPFFIYRMIEKSNDSPNGWDAKRKQTITITTPGRSQAPIEKLLDDVCQEAASKGKDRVKIWVWNGSEIALADERSKRSMDTVYCSDDVKKTVIEDVATFLASKESYVQRGIPYRRGYLFEGPPGTGKTTMIYALASLINRAVYTIAAGSITNDKELLKAINEAAANQIVVIEDIDSLRAAENRETAQKTELVVAASSAGITLSGLLNAMDGLCAREGRILFVTTNKPETLDAAVLRDGRIDMRVHFGPAGPDEAAAMFRRFHPKGDVAGFLEKVGPELPMAQAKLQTMLLGR